MLVIRQSEVERLLPVGDCVAVMRGAMLATSARAVTLPLRQYLAVPAADGETAGSLAMMPGTLGDPACFGIKLVCKYPRPHGDPLGSHVGMVLLFDTAKGVPLALIEGSSLTAIRTSAASALATDLLARRDAARLAVIGNGEQAMRHVTAMMAVRPITSVTVWGRDEARRADFVRAVTQHTGLACTPCASVAAAVDGADIICTTTSARTPVLFGADLQPGQHLNLVGSAVATTAEVDDAAVARARVFVDYRPAADAAAGELIGALARGVITQDHVIGEIGEVAAGRVEGRMADGDITLYKSLGVASQDLAAAHALWQAAQRQGLGVNIDLLA
jgi:ornithine cyclodeaminase/alanine dehydrogenase-like protein (mu-crystallin family)|nr:ornithine cyclodeaminase family protein [uncultured Sandarakinorhabdus sp.]